MGNDTVYVLFFQAYLIKDLTSSFHHYPYGKSIHQIALHLNVMEFRFHSLTGRRHSGSSGRKDQHVTAGSIRSQDAFDDTFAQGTRPDDGSPCSVTKQHASVSVFPIHNLREYLSADYKDIIVPAGSHKIPRNGKSIDKPCASCADIESSSILGSDFPLNHTCT
jgi:hypothetical protein